MGCVVRFRVMLDQRLVFTNLDANGILHALYLKTVVKEDCIEINETLPTESPNDPPSVWEINKEKR